MLKNSLLSLFFSCIKAFDYLIIRVLIWFFFQTAISFENIWRQFPKILLRLFFRDTVFILLICCNYLFVYLVLLTRQGIILGPYHHDPLFFFTCGHISSKSIRGCFGCPVYNWCFIISKTKLWLCLIYIETRHALDYFFSGGFIGVHIWGVFAFDEHWSVTLSGILS